MEGIKNLKRRYKMKKLEIKLVTPHAVKNSCPDSCPVHESDYVAQNNCAPDESCGPDTCPVCGPANPECSP